MILGVIGDDFTGSSALLTRGLSQRLLTQDQVRELATRFRS